MKDAAAKPRREAERSGRPVAAPTTEQFVGAGDGPGPTGVTPAVLAHLQLQAGNGAVAGLVAPLQRKGDAGSCPPPPPAPVPADPHADPKFAKVAGGAGRASKDLKSHPPAAQEAQNVRDAAVPPSDDRASQAKAAQVETMAAAKSKGFDKAGFIAAVKGAIAAAAPKDLDEADSFATSSKPDEIKASVASKVTSGKSESAKDVAEKTSQPPNLSAAKEKVVVPLRAPPPAKPVAVNGAAGMPDKAPPEQTDFRAGPCEVDGTMRAEGVTEEHLVKSNEAPMQDAAVAKREAEAHAAIAPGAVRQHEGSTLRAAQAGAGADAKAGVAAMAATRTGSGSRVAAQKAAAKAKEEADRARVSGDINAIFDRTKTETEAILTGLDDKVSTLFDAGEAYAKAAFTAKHTADMQRYKDLRYSGLDGAARWTHDLFAGMPPEANQIFDRARAVYEAKMTEVISRLADVIGAELQRAKARIDQGRQEIKTYVANQPKELQKLASETAQAVGEQFDELESDVDDKQAQLVDDLAQRYVESRNGVDEEIKAEQEKNKGLVDKAKDAVGGAIDAIVKLKDLFAGVLARAASAFSAILDDPIGFIGNFFSALGQGFTNFSNNILTHLKRGVFGWLLGTLSNAGIEMPDSFDIKGIFKLIASILGLTWSSIKSRIMRIAPWIGKGIDVVESKVEVFAALASQGVAGIWEWIKDKVGDLSEMVIGPVKEFVSEKIIQAGVSWLLGLLNPAGALIKIIQALVGVVQWLVERGAQLAEFLNTVIDAVGEVARGGIGGVPAKIESALAKAVPLVISFLASLLNLGGISEKVKSVLDAVKKPVGKAIDGVIKRGLKAAKGLFRKRPPSPYGEQQKAGGSPEDVKGRALDDAVAKTRGLDRFSGFQTALTAVVKEYRPRGLKSLVADIPSESDLTIEITATASPPSQRTISWAEAFPGDDLAKLREYFRKQTHQTYAAITLNGALVGKVETNLPRKKGGPDDPKKHAESVLMKSHWQTALEHAKSPNSGKKPKLVFAINRTPCPACSKTLTEAIEKAKKEPALAKVRFILAPTGVYEGKSIDKTTKYSDLATLVDVGWDLQQLMARDKVSRHTEWWDVPLAETAHRLWLEFKAKVKGK